MNPINKWAKTTWKQIQAYFTDVNSEYRLVSTPLPELYKLKSAHQELLQAYSESLAASSRLSFFVKMNEVKPATEGWAIGVFRKIIWASFSPLRLLIWRPVINLYLQAHIYNKLKELTAAYTFASFLPSITVDDEQKIHKWIPVAKEDCQRFMTALGLGKLLRETANLILLALVNILAAAWGANNFFDLVLKIPTSSPPIEVLVLFGKVIAFILLALPFTLTFIDAAFSAKRAIFIHINAHKDQETVYKLENRLFELLGLGKAKEFAIDFAVIAFFYSILIAFIWSFHIAIAESAKYTSAIMCDISWCFLLPLIAMFGSDVIAPWVRRARNGEM